MLFKLHIDLSIPPVSQLRDKEYIDEIQQILRLAADDASGIVRWQPSGSDLHAFNGNKVGRWEYTQGVPIEPRCDLHKAQTPRMIGNLWTDLSGKNPEIPNGKNVWLARPSEDVERTHLPFLMRFPEGIVRYSGNRKDAEKLGYTNVQASMLLESLQSFVSLTNADETNSKAVFMLAANAMHGVIVELEMLRMAHQACVDRLDQLEA